MSDFFSLSLLLIYAALYGITMKVADLLNEHGMKWFRGSTLLFGLLWGFFGILLVLSRADIANVTLAMVLAYIIRLRIDYRNHAFAVIIIIITFLLKSTFQPALFGIFFATFVVFGSIRDYIGNVRKKRDWIFKLYELALYYSIATAIYGLLTGNWAIFAVFTTYTLFYNLTKYGLFYAKKYRRL